MRAAVSTRHVAGTPLPRSPEPLHTGRVNSDRADERISEVVEAAHGSAADAVGGELVSPVVDIPWDHYLGNGAGRRIADGSLSLVRHAYPATAARAMRQASSVTGHLVGDQATHERLAAVGVALAARHHRPARMPHRPGEEPHAWWIAEEQTLVWLPWADIDEQPYGLALLDSGEADSVVVLAPDAAWTVFRSGIPRDGAHGGWAELAPRLRAAIIDRLGHELPQSRWRRRGDTVTVSWKQDAAVRSIAVAVNRHRDTPAAT